MNKKRIKSFNLSGLQDKISWLPDLIRVRGLKSSHLFNGLLESIPR